MDLRLIPAGLLALTLLSACGGGQSADEPAGSSPAASPAASSTGNAAGLVAASAAACNEVNRLTREGIDGLTDPQPANWERFAIALQNVANGAPDPAMRDALTSLATGALTASERLGAGSNVRDAVVDFDAAIPAVDQLCKKVGMPLN